MVMSNVVGIVITQAKDKEFRLRRRVGRQLMQLRGQREVSMIRELRRFYSVLERAVVKEIKAVGQIPSVEEIFRPATFADRFSQTILPHLSRSLFTGAQFEDDFVKSIRPKEDQTIRQVSGPTSPPDPPDIKLPPGIDVELTPAMRRKISEFLRERSVAVWNKVGRTIRRKLEREILKAMENGDTFRVLERRLIKLLRNIRNIQPMAIARTEIGLASNKGSQFQRTELDIPSKEWISTIDNKNRGADPTSPFDHLKPDGQVVANAAPFRVSGELLPVPLDSSMGASAGNVIQCFLPGTRIDGSVEVASRSFYNGQAVEIVTRCGKVLRVTNNHPILTEQGFVPAGLIEQRQKLVCYIRQDNGSFDGVFSLDISTGFESNNYDEPSFVEQVFRSFALFGFLERRRSTSHDFYGDGQFIYGDVEIVRPDWELLRARESALSQHFSDAIFVKEYSIFAPGHGNGHFCFGSNALLAAESCCPSSRALSLDELAVRLHHAPLDSLLFGSGAKLDVVFSEYSVHNIPVVSDVACELVNRCAEQVIFDDVVDVRKFDFCGHVYDLQTMSGLIIADGVLCSNCRCASIASLENVLSQSSANRLWDSLT